MAVAHTDLRVETGIGTLETRSPATGEVIGTVPIFGEKEVAAAVARARDAAAQWGALSHAERRVHLIAWRRELARRADELAELIHRENGKPRTDAMAEVMVALAVLHHATERAARALRTRTVSPGLMFGQRARISYHPFGVVAVIGPWNYPAFTPMGSSASALAAGNTVVFKPSELTPLVGCFLAETAAAAIPIADVFQAVTGDGRTGQALARAAVDKIAFTGSTTTGRKVMQAAAERITPVVLELGGKDPLIVAPDADVDRAAEAAVWGALTNAGQACVSIERVYVASELHDRFVDVVVREVRKLRTGAGDDAQIGPITRPEQVGVIREHLEDALKKGARVLVGGPDGIDGAFVPPTVLVGVTDEMKIMREETFGPVLPILRVESVDEALRRSNATAFGLGSAVFAREGARQIADRLRAGATAINSVLTYAFIPSLPFGGVGDSGFGRVHGDEGLREFSRVKATTEEWLRLPFSATTFKVPANAYAQLRGLVQQVFGGGVVDRVRGALARLTPR